MPRTRRCNPDASGRRIFIHLRLKMIDTDFCSNSLVHTSLGQRNVSMAAKATSAAVAADAAVRVFDVSVDGASGGAAATADPRSLLTASEEGSKLFRSVGKEPVATVSVIGAARCVCCSTRSASVSNTQPP